VIAAGGTAPGPAALRTSGCAHNDGMLADIASAVQVADLLLLLVGVVLLAGLALAARRRGSWRDPLAGCALPVPGPDVPQILAACLVFFGAQLLLVELTIQGRPRAELARYGSDTWFRAQAATIGAQILAIVFMTALLLRRRHAATDSAPTPPPRHVLTSASAGLAAFVVLLPLVAVLWNAGNVVWKWMHPALPPPLHPVLLAIDGGVWGRWGTLQLLLGAVLVAPVAEELLFRGVLLSGLCRAWGLVWPSILLSAAAFGFVHGQPQDVLPLVLMGVVLGFVRVWTGRLWPCVLAHMLFNTRTVTLALLSPQTLRTGQ